MSSLADVIVRAKSVRIEGELAHRGINLKGHVERTGPCPICGGRDRFSINTKKQVWNCRGCRTGGDVIKLVEHLDGVEFKQAIEKLAGAQETGAAGPSEARMAPSPSRADNGALAASIWQDSIDPRETIVERYLASRGLELPQGDCSRFIRFHASCPFGTERHPALVALIRNIETDASQGIQRTALDPDGTAIKRDGKTLRMMLGPMAGGAIKIDPDEHVEQGLCIGEGLETCLAGCQLGLRPVWAMGSVSGISSFPVLSGRDGLTLLAERDDASARAIEACAKRWLAAGREIIVIDPTFGDANDALKVGRSR
jgi:Toprim domain/CHC2 zinc finger